MTAALDNLTTRREALTAVLLRGAVVQPDPEVLADLISACRDAGELVYLADAVCASVGDDVFESDVAWGRAELALKARAVVPVGGAA